MARPPARLSGKGSNKPPRVAGSDSRARRPRFEPPSGDDFRRQFSRIVGAIRRAAEKTECRSWSCSLLFHVTVLLALASLLPNQEPAQPTTISLTVTLQPAEDEEVSFEPVVDIEPDMPDGTGNPNPEQQELSSAALEGVIPDVTTDSVVTVDTAPELLFAEDHIEAVPDSETLIAEVNVRDIGREGQGSSDGVGEIDGGDLTSFFGVRASGRAVAYVVDCSGSMEGPPLERLKRELIDSIRELPEHSLFTVIFFNHGAIPFGGMRPKLLEASASTKAKVIAWVSQIEAEGGTNPQEALFTALTLEPSVVFLMTDGQFTFPFDRRLMAIMSRSSDEKARINTIAFGDQAATDPLQEIARMTRGTFAFVGIGNR